MLPDDPRHGTTRGHNAGCRCEPCGDAKLRYDKARKFDRHRGKERTVSALGTRRRIRALQALGHSLPAIAQASGESPKTISDICYRSERAYLRTVNAVKKAYEVLSMELATSHFAERSRRAARAKGWAPPLAWDDHAIDDPNARPNGAGYIADNRSDAIGDLAEMGVGITEACRRLHLSRDALERWCQRKGLNDAYLQMAGREALWENQHTREAS